MTISEPRWLALLRAEAGRTSKTAVADRLGYSRTAISLVLAGRYCGKTDRIAKVVIALLETTECPHLKRSMPVSECRSLALAPAPMHHPIKLAQWRACQRCPNRPTEGEDRANHD